MSFQTCMTYFLMWNQKEDIFHVQAALLHTMEIVQNVVMCIHCTFVYMSYHQVQPMTFDFADAKLGTTHLEVKYLNLLQHKLTKLIQ